MAGGLWGQGQASHAFLSAAWDRSAARPDAYTTAQQRPRRGTAVSLVTPAATPSDAVARAWPESSTGAPWCVRRPWRLPPTRPSQQCSLVASLHLPLPGRVEKHYAGHAAPVGHQKR